MSPDTLRPWERRFGHLEPQRSAGRHPLCTHGEVAAPRDALQQGLSISSAVSRASEVLGTDTHRRYSPVQELGGPAVVGSEDERREAQA